MRDLESLEREILSTFFTTYGDALSKPATPLGQKSGMWNNPNKLFRSQLSGRSLIENIRRVQRDGQFDYALPPTSAVGAQVIEEQIDFLDTLGLDIMTAPPDLCESFLADPSLVYRINGRDLSTDFLYRLIMTQRVWDVLSRPSPRVLEIGAAMGGFARVAKTRNPAIRYIIIDLLDSIILSYSCLRLRFPDAKTLLINDPIQLEAFDSDADFTFIPAELADGLRDLKVDLALNTFSLGEMPQQVVENYMDLIQNRLHVDRFYSLNRYLQPDSWVDWRDEEYSASYSTPVDCNWKVLHWEYCPPMVRQIGRHQLYAFDGRTTLELYLEREPDRGKDEDGLRRKSDELLNEALELGELQGARWHRLMWESIQSSPRLENVEPFHEFLKKTDSRERRYFGRLLQRLGAEVPDALPRSAPQPKRGLRHLAGRAIRRCARPILRLLET